MFTTNEEMIKKLETLATDLYHAYAWVSNKYDDSWMIIDDITEKLWQITKDIKKECQEKEPIHLFIESKLDEENISECVLNWCNNLFMNKCPQTMKEFILEEFSKQIHTTISETLLQLLTQGDNEPSGPYESQKK